MTANYPALVLNADFTPVSRFPLSVWGFERTLTKTLKGRVIVVDEYDALLRGPSLEYRPPSVVALRQYVKKSQSVAFNRMNIFLRDDFRCQYCGGRFDTKDLTFDHVIPRCRGGGTSFENIVSACVPCNTRKGHRQDMKPLRQPSKPSQRDLARSWRPREPMHSSWSNYLDYWGVALDQD